MSSENKSVVDKVFLLLAFILITLGAIGSYKDYSIPLSIVIVSTYLGITILHTGRIQVPAHSKLFFVSLIVLLIHTILMHGKIAYFWLFLSSGLYWIAFYNVKGLTSGYFHYFIASLGILMAAIFLFVKSIGLNSFSPDNLFLPLSTITVHNHLGDLWAIIIVMLLGGFLKKFVKWNILLTTIGVLIIMFSYSRSAILSVLAGTVFVNYKNNKLIEIKKYIYLITAICIAILLYFSLTKSIIFSRPYFSEAIISIINTPLGIGMGNFAKVSPETNNVHNLILEFAVGMGIFSIFFLYWLFNILIDLFKNKEKNVIYSAVIISLITNFLFDTTYVIPAMIWIFFSPLALV